MSELAVMLAPVPNHCKEWGIKIESSVRKAAL